MSRSLRTRLLIWVTLILLAAVAGFGALVLYSVWRTRLDDIDAALAARTAALARALRPAADGTFDLALSGAPAEPGSAGGRYHAIWTSDGVLIDRSDDAEARQPPAASGLATRAGRRELVIDGAHGARILAGQDLSAVRGDLWRLAASMGLMGLVAAAAGAGGAWVIAARAVRPLHRIGDTARAMTQGDFDARVPVEHVDTELGEVAHALNEAFDRLQAALARQRRFSADASHELRTPLATISTELQWTLARDREPDEYRQSLAAMQRAAARMQAIVERLLSLARAEATADPAEPVALDDVTRAVLADFEPLASRKTLSLRTSLEPVSVRAPREPLRDAITNIVANAVQYTPDRGQIEVAVTRGEGRARLTVRDSGIGIAPEHLPRIFEPFYRGTAARTADGHGAGLGLAVAHAVVIAAGGTIDCASAPGQGTTITVTLPASDAPVEGTPGDNIAG